MEVKKDSVLHITLGKLRYFSAGKLMRNISRFDHDKLILSLAHAHGDIKSFMMYWDILDEFRPPIEPPDHISAKSGYYAGRKWFVYRFVVSVLCEILVLLEKNKEILDKDEFGIAISKLDPQFRKTWEQLISLARNVVPDSAVELKQLRNKISAVRDTITFHYSHGSKLTDGYNAALTPEARAYFTEGSSLEETSFLFADAAAERVLMDTFNLDPTNLSNDSITVFIRAAHVSIAMLIRQYLMQVQADLHTLGSSNGFYKKQ